MRGVRCCPARRIDGKRNLDGGSGPELALEAASGSDDSGYVVVRSAVGWAVPAHPLTGGAIPQRVATDRYRGPTGLGTRLPNRPVLMAIR